MDSDESRPGSSASNSSDSSSTGPNNKIASPTSERKSRSKSPASGKSGSRSSSSASSRDNSVDKSPENHSNSPPVRRNSNGNRSVSRNQSISPARKSNSPKERSNSRNSTVSSVNLNPEEISDGEMESDKEDEEKPDGSLEKSKEGLNISHEDLSDVSDLESAPSENEKDDPEEEDDDEISADKTKITDLRMRLDEKKNQLKSMDDQTEKDQTNGTAEHSLNDLDKKNDEDALDFEAEEGECNEVVKEDKPEVKEIEEKKNESDGEAEEGEELEEGEVTDGDEKRPEENEPKPVCRFYTRGQCTWGMSCRFLHPGVTDKGNYTMFDMVRPVPVPHGAGPYGPPSGGGYHEYRNERPPLHHAPPHPGYGAPSAHPRGAPQPEAAAESAWERGLRTAKEMMRKANKRKEQDMDFEDKKMNLSLAQDELEKDNYYTRDRASPELSPPPYGRPPAPAHYEAEPYSPPPKFPPRGAAPPFEEDPYARGAPRYRELPAHRMPQYEDEVIGKPRRIRPAREVIVQRAEPSGRADDWNDPWMRSKSPGRGGEKRSRRDRRSYSSNSSYSSSSSSRSQSSSDTSRSPSPATARRRRYDSHQSKEAAPARYNKSPGRRPHHGKGARSPTPKRRHSPVHPENRIINELLPPNKKYTNNRKNSGNENDLIDRKLMPPPPIPKSFHQLKSCIVFGSRRSPPVQKRGDKRIISPNQHEKRTERVPITGPVPNKRKRPISPPTANSKKPGPTSATDRNNKIKKRKTSSSGSSDSSGSESDSSYSGSSSDSSHSPNSKTVRRDKLAPERKPVQKKVEMSKKRPTPPTPAEPKSSQSIPTTNQPPVSAAPSVNSKKTTRREELLKQLKAVEEAIARKRSKIN